MTVSPEPVVDGALVLCRPAYASDRTEVQAFLNEIWGSEDYVLEVLDEWMHDTVGLLAVAERGGHVVGMGHLADLGNGEWWLEGLRVDPSVQRQNVGSTLHDYTVGRWVETGGDVVRLATNDEKVAVHKMCERTGFSLRTRVRGVDAPAQRGRHGFVKVEQSARAEVIEKLASSKLADLWGGLIDLGWRFAELTGDRIRQSDLGLWTWGEGRVVLATSEDEIEEPPALVIGALAGDRSNGLPDSIKELPALAADLGMGAVFWLLPADSWLEDVARSGGFGYSKDHAMRIYERYR